MDGCTGLRSANLPVRRGLCRCHLLDIMPQRHAWSVARLQENLIKSFVAGLGRVRNARVPQSVVLALDSGSLEALGNITVQMIDNQAVSFPVGSQPMPQAIVKLHHPAFARLRDVGR